MHTHQGHSSLLPPTTAPYCILFAAIPPALTPFIVQIWRSTHRDSTDELVARLLLLSAARDPSYGSQGSSSRASFTVAPSATDTTAGIAPPLALEDVEDARKVLEKAWKLPPAATPAALRGAALRLALRDVTAEVFDPSQVVLLRVHSHPGRAQ